MLLLRTGNGTARKFPVKSIAIEISRFECNYSLFVVVYRTKRHIKFANMYLVHAACNLYKTRDGILIKHEIVRTTDILLALQVYTHHLPARVA